MAFAERIHAGITVEEASAVAGLYATEMGRPFGRAETVEAGPARLAGYDAELADLQTRMNATPLRWSDLQEAPGGAVTVAGAPLLPGDQLALRAAERGASEALEELARSPAPRAA
jgi:hypothetical protein